jgi:hypothetical protein
MRVYWYWNCQQAYLDSPNMMICAACCKEHSTRAEWCTDHLGLSWSHSLIVLDGLWAVPSNVHMNTADHLHLSTRISPTVGPNFTTPVGSTSPTPSSCFYKSDWPHFSQTFIFNNTALPDQSTNKTDYELTPQSHNSQGTCAKQGLTSQLTPQSRASKT